jgi:hypothetical protein
MAHLRVVNAIAKLEHMESVRAAARTLFPDDWEVELVGQEISPLLVSVNVRDKEGCDMGGSLFQPNHLGDVPPFLERMAAVVKAKGLM